MKATEKKAAGAVAEYYDTFLEDEYRRGLNLRHYFLFNKIVEAGLKKNHRVLEIGCGVGNLTVLLHKYISSGKIFSTDISSQGIAIAKRHFGGSQKVEFVVDDMTGFRHPDKFDFVILADVLEHIPESQHEILFTSIRSLMKPQSQVFINIPYSRLLLFFEKSAPEKLQIIDQPLYIENLAPVFEKTGLQVYAVQPHALFYDQNDYLMIRLVCKEYVSEFTDAPKHRIILRKAYNRIKSFFYTM